jgi:hypothetical protein
MVVPLIYLVSILFIVNEFTQQHHLTLRQSFSSSTTSAFNLFLIFNSQIILTVLLTVDMFLSMIPVRVFHFYFSAVYGLIYYLVVAFAYLKINYHLYTIWVDLIIFICIIVGIHLIHFLFYRVKISFFNKYLSQKAEITFE